MRTAFIVSTYNRPDALLEVLRGLAGQCTDRHEVIIADDGSSPVAVQKILAELPRFRCSVRHVWHPDVGFTLSRVRNLGVLACHADYLVFMDGDCVPSSHFGASHEALAEPGFFVNGSRVLLSESLTGKIITGQAGFADATWLTWLRWRIVGDVNKLIHLIQLPDMSLRRESHFRWKRIRGCNIGVWRKDYLRINGFDESFTGWGHEDADFVLRLHNAGVQRKNGFCSTEVYHLWHPESSRSEATSNRERVTQRIETGVTRAKKGVDEAALADDVVVRKFN